VRTRFLPPISLKQLEDAIQKEWYENQLETVQNLHECVPRRFAVVLKAKVFQHHNNKEICAVSIVFPLFYPSTCLCRKKHVPCLC
jgi:hypothetical protein